MVMMTTMNDNGDDHQYSRWTNDDEAEKENKLLIY